MFNVFPLSYGCMQEVAKHERSVGVTRTKMAAIKVRFFEL